MYNPEIHHRQSIRLREHDYAGTGAYFITICVHERECLFGDIVNGAMVLNDPGMMVEKWWQDVAGHFLNVVVDEYIIMPNHFHGIVVINDVGAGSPRPDDNNVETKQGGETPENQSQGGETPENQRQGGETPENQRQGGETPPLRTPTLGQVVGYFKYQTTKQINQMRDNPGVPVWQRNYYERIVRDEEELAAIREYIADNPAKWTEDKENPDFT